MAEATTTPPNNEETIHRLSVQLKKLTEANNKYKNLLKLAKDRIQAHEDELAALRESNSQMQTRLDDRDKDTTKNGEGNNKRDVLPADAVTFITNVCQRVKVGENEIWALMEFKVCSEESPQHNKEYKEWVSFNSESQLQDYIRRDTGEPLTIPPFSMTLAQSEQVQLEANQRVNKVTEEFRRFRVKSELARKQADAQIKELQNAKNHTVVSQQVNDNPPRSSDGRFAAVAQQQMERLQAEMAAQEAYWKESYETVLAENNALKATGSEALLASQWRQRYETCKSEKEELEETLKSVTASGSSITEAQKYEQKYRELKGECFNIGTSLRPFSHLFLKQSRFDYTAKRPKRSLRLSSLVMGAGYRRRRRSISQAMHRPTPSYHISKTSC